MLVAQGGVGAVVSLSQALRAQPSAAAEPHDGVGEKNKLAVWRLLSAWRRALCTVDADRLHSKPGVLGKLSN